MNTARISRTISSLLSSGVELTKSISITEKVVQNTYYKKAMEESQKSVIKGVPFSVVFKERTSLFPVMVGEMIEVGEETGKLADMLLDITAFYEDEVDEKTKNLSVIVEPVLMVIIGAAVGFFAVSMITPLYSILDNIK